MTRARPTAFRNYVQVLYALVIHDIKTRYFGNGLGQILLLIWPFVHLVFLVGAYSFSGRAVPFGNSLLLFACTGAIPWIVFSYMSRWIVFSPMSNRPLLNYPVVTPLDLFISRAFLELMNSFLIVVLVLVLLVVVGCDPWPNNVVEAFAALAACVALAFGLGVLNAAVVVVSNMWATVFILFQIGLYIISGLIFLPSAMPENIRYILSFNPVLQCIEWMRAAYFADYPRIVLDRAYLLEFSFIALALGLILERFVRRRLFLM